MKTAVSVPEAAAPTGMKLPVSAAAAQSQRQPEPPSTSGKNPVSAEFTEAEPYFSPAVRFAAASAKITGSAAKALEKKSAFHDFLKFFAQYQSGNCHPVPAIRHPGFRERQAVSPHPRGV